MAYKDFRSFLEYLEQEGQLLGKMENNPYAVTVFPKSNYFSIAFMSLFPSRTKLISLISRFFGTLIVIDLAAISAVAKPKINPINLTTNNLNAQETVPPSNSLETFLAKQPITTSPRLSFTEDKSLNTEEHDEPQLFNFSRKASDLSFQQSTLKVPSSFSNLYAQQETKPPDEATKDGSSEKNSETSTTEIDSKERSTTANSNKKLSLLDAAPQMLMLMRKSPLAFGAPTTVVENFGSNTQLTADWGGARTQAADNGILFEIYSTTLAQGITSGGNNNSSAVTQSLDAYLNIDTGRNEMWPGGVFQATFQSRFGSNVNGDVGSIAPVNSAAEWPIAGPDNVGLVTEYYLLQSFSPKLLLLIGKFDPTAYAEVNVFANSYRYQFQNFALNNNLMLGSYAPVSTWGSAIIWQPAKFFQLISGVLDPNASAENFADDFFKDATVFQEFNFAYKIAERPGNLRLIWALNTKDSSNLEEPLNFRIVNGQPVVDFRDPIQKNDSSFAFLANFDQYLFTTNPKATQEYHQRSETSHHHIAHRVYAPPPGLGVFGRFGIGPESENLVSLFASFGISGIGLIPGREYDRFGLGWYYVGISDDLLDFINSSTLVSDTFPSDGAAENGLEFYYNFAITPAIQLSADVQYIFNPEFSTENHALILGGRLQVAF